MSSEARAVPPWRGRWLEVGAWSGAVAIAAALLQRRLDVSLAAGNGYDLLHCFVPAARAVAAGGDPYAVACYVYPPVLADALAPVADLPDLRVWWTVGSLALGVGAIAVSAIAYRRRLVGWRMPLFAAYAVVTLLWTWPITREFQIGGTNLILLVLLAAAAAAHRRPALSGASIAGAALVKTWPAALGLWLVRRGARTRLRAVVVSVLVVAVGIGVAFLPLAPSAPLEWVQSTIRLGVQPHPSYSALGLGEEVFGSGTLGAPVLASPILRWTTTLAVEALAVVLLVVVLTHPCDPVLALWQVTGCVLLLMPTSHIVYLTLLVPVAWGHLARALSPGRGRADIVMAGVVTAWWFAAMRPWSPETLGGFLVTVLATLVMLALSVAMSVAMTARAEVRGQAACG